MRPLEAATLLELSERVRTNGSPLLGIARRNLFCLVVGRSVMRGVPDPETAESLQRFGTPIAAILSAHSS